MTSDGNGALHIICIIYDVLDVLTYNPLYIFLVICMYMYTIVTAYWSPGKGGMSGPYVTNSHIHVVNT